MEGVAVKSRGQAQVAEDQARDLVTDKVRDRNTMVVLGEQARAWAPSSTTVAWDARCPPVLVNTREAARIV